MLKVQDFQKIHARSTERSVERAWADTWEDMGIYSRHMSDAVPGLPDRYVRGGRWVEFKSLWRKRGGFTVGEGLSQEQWRTAADLLNAGDKVWLISQLDGWSEGKVYLMLPMEDVIGWRGDRVRSEWLVGVTPKNRRTWSEKNLG